MKTKYASASPAKPPAIMYEEGVREYRDAKRKAAKAFGPEKTLSLGSHLPSNAEIHEELSRFIRMNEGDLHPGATSPAAASGPFLA
ncbi:MAG: hypothetical protein MZV70_74245 [Desulfobacterales bacterium]|nr:hypothetical protein [Desulfobacterales bacterium]